MGNIDGRYVHGGKCLGSGAYVRFAVSHDLKAPEDRFQVNRTEAVATRLHELHLQHQCRKSAVSPSRH